MGNNFGVILREMRMGAGISRNKLAHAAGVNPSYLTRIEQGVREPPRLHIVEAIARGLALGEQARNQLIVAAGYAPVTVSQIGHWDDSLQAVAEVLTDFRLSPHERDQFRSVVMMIAARWHGEQPVIGTA